MLGIIGSLITFIVLSANPSLLSKASINPSFPRIANCYGIGLTPESKADDIDEIAKTDLFIGGVWCNWNNEEHVKRLQDHVKELRQKNSHIIILDFSVSAPYVYLDDKTFPESGWLKQPDGRYIDGWPGTRMINLLKAETINWLVQRCTRLLKDPKMKGIFDGVFIDSMAGTFDWWACNIATQEPYEVDADEDNQPDDHDWLNKKWTEAKTELARLVREAIGSDKIFMTNQGGEWSFPYTNGVLFEDNLDYVIDGNANWDDVIESYLHWTETPNKPNVTTIVSSSGITPPFDAWRSITSEERDAILTRGRNLFNRMRFGLATTLMGNGYFAYDLHTRWRGQRWWYSEYDAPLGYPKDNAKKQKNGTWRREFDGGTVIVNPTILDAEVHFDEKRLDVSSGKIDTYFIIPSYDGRLFIPTEEEFRQGTIADPKPLFTISGSSKILQREGKILFCFNNYSACFDNRGRLLILTDGEHTLATSGKAVLVKDNRWIDFGYENNKSQIIDESTVQFIGERVDGNVRLEYYQTVSIKEGKLIIHYKWKALTNGSLYAWRQQIDFPDRYYIGGQFSIDGVISNLPITPEKGNVSNQGFHKIVMIQQGGSQIAIETSQNALLQDERVYNGREYCVLFTPIGYGTKPFKSGDIWEYTLTIFIP